MGEIKKLRYSFTQESAEDYLVRIAPYWEKQDIKKYLDDQKNNPRCKRARHNYFKKKSYRSKAYKAFVKDISDAVKEEML